jgi:hypothetical protein
MNHVRSARLLALAARLLDFSPWAGLAFLPAKILPLSRGPFRANEAQAYLRFVGAFITWAGETYLFKVVRVKNARLRALFKFTLLFPSPASLPSGNDQGRFALRWACVTAAHVALIEF